jgi:hypothetical protein
MEAGGGERAGEDDVNRAGLRDGAFDRGGCASKDSYLGGDSGGAGERGLGACVGASDDHAGRSEEVGDGLTVLERCLIQTLNCLKCHKV